MDVDWRYVANRTSRYISYTQNNNSYNRKTNALCCNIFFGVLF